MYNNPLVAALATTHFVPVRVHLRHQKDEFERLGKRYDAHWTPTTLVISSDGTERHRIEGFLPAEDFLTQLMLGLGHAAFAAEQYKTAEERFRDVVEQHGFTDAAPEALYWAGVSRYKAIHDPAALKETAKAFEKYPESTWAKKASVWNS